MPSRLDHTYNVLLIESDAKETEVYTDLIKEVADCKIDVMSRVGGSFEWIDRSQYHLIVIDISSLGEFWEQDKDPLTVLERIRRMSPETSVILISEQARIDQAVAAIRLGAEDYLKKPFNLEKFELAVKRGLDRKKIFGHSADLAGFLNLLNSCQMISASLEPKKIFKIVQSYLARELNSNYTAIYEVADQSLKPVRADENSLDGQFDQAMDEILDIAVQTASPFAKMSEGESFRFFDRGKLSPGLFVFRFRCVGETDYFCICLSPIRPASLEGFESRINMIRTQIEVTGTNIKQYLGVKNLVYVDDLTGLYNTRYLNYVLDNEIKQADSSGRSFAVLFLDIDKFKKVNDQYGHLVGSGILKEMGQLIRQHVRDSDNTFRYGGDEFVAVLSPSDPKTAARVAERIRASVEKKKFRKVEKLDISLTVSIGVALYPQHASSQKMVIEAADKVMYSAKEHRNRVYVADDLVDKPKRPKSRPKLLKGGQK